jgi:hypothetical protein
MDDAEIAVSRQTLTDISESKFAKALNSLIELTATNKDFPYYIWHNIGLCHQQLGHYEIAIDFYRKAISVEDHAQIHWNISLCHLILGNLQEGFREHEYRLEVCGKTSGWQGEEIADKTLVVLRDGGFGDTIQFLRYVPLLRNYGCKVYCDIQPELRCLFGDFLSAISDPFQATEDMVHVYLMSLPYCFKTELHTIPPPAKIRCRLSPKKRKVGIVWQGSKENSCDRDRSIPLREFIPLLSMPEIRYVCLQKEVPEEERQILHSHHVQMPCIDSFLDTVEQIQECEYVISVCSSVAHLSGTMGVPTLIPLAFNHCWRWLKDRTDSPWYPSVRLFRQKSHGEWSIPLREIQQVLTKNP